MTHAQALVHAAVALLGLIAPIAICLIGGRIDVAQLARRNPSNDVIVACLQKSGMPSYGVGPAGPAIIGKPLTPEMFTVICVEEK